MKTDFYKPQRQNFRGILVIFLMDLAKRIKENIFAFLPLLSSNIRQNYWEFIVLGFTLLLVLQLLYSYKSYLNFKFHIQDGRFFLRHGVFKFTDVDIAFDRIQNININQNLIQQMLNVVGFEIETAGQGKAEISIKALSREDAVELKHILLENKTENINENIETPTKTATKPEVLFHLNLKRLLKVGISSNYLKGLGLVFAFIATLFQYIEDIFSNLFGVHFEETYLNQIPETLGYIAGFVIFIIAAAFIVTVATSVIKYFELKITKVDNEFEVDYGLFKRVNQVIKKSKTQVFEVEQNPIKDLFGIKNIFISQASSEELNKKKKIGIVGVSNDEINIMFQSLFDLPYAQEFVVRQSSMRLIIQLMIRYFILSLGVGIGLYFWQNFYISSIVFLILMVIFSIISYKTVKKSHIGVNENLIKIHSGSIHTNMKYIATHKIQSLALKRNWYQQRNQHADLLIYTASGDEQISYLKHKEALEIINFLTYKVESSQHSWI
ncbi:PH domain-containing protein [Flavobacterium sp. CS20]|uniref:PH domain-containing protein n=1 Tax=Flavobacterium sp. CS20 TaxID=2775246 RepID=UPI001B39FCC7|nr:PH domain-containing protein [Flavobacterium sp. CS20]QTY28254.1 PH domain-containing protein [Flavobacterium sp. CS20]